MNNIGYLLEKVINEKVSDEIELKLHDAVRDKVDEIIEDRLCDKIKYVQDEAVYAITKEIMSEYEHELRYKMKEIIDSMDLEKVTNTLIQNMLIERVDKYLYLKVSDLQNEIYKLIYDKFMEFKDELKIWQEHVDKIHKNQDYLLMKIEELKK